MNGIVVVIDLFPDLGWFAIPDLPHHRTARFLTEEEKDSAIKRLGESRKHRWDLTVFRRVLLSWQFWLLPTVFMRKPTSEFPEQRDHQTNTQYVSSILPLRAVTQQ